MGLRAFSLLVTFLMQSLSSEASSSLQGCDPHFNQALHESAVQGIERSTATVHATHTRPSSTFDLSCLGDFMNGFNGLSFLMDPGKLFGDFLNTLKNQICDHADRLWQEKRRKFEGITPDLVFKHDLPGVEMRSHSYELGKRPVSGQVESFSPDVDLVLPKVGGKELSPSSLRGLLQ